MFKKIKSAIVGLFTRKTFELTQSEHSAVKQLPQDMQVAELMFKEALRTGQLRFNTIQERAKARDAWHMSWMACQEYQKVRK